MGQKSHLIYYQIIFWTQLQLSLQIHHPEATQLFPEETYYKAYILEELKFSHCICIKLAVQVRFLLFFWLCHMPSVTVKSPWPIRTKYQQQIPQPLMFIKYLRNYNEAPTKYTGVLCFVFNLQWFCLKIQTFKAIWCWAAYYFTSELPFSLHYLRIYFYHMTFWFCKLKFINLFSTQLLNKIGTIWREIHSLIFWWHIYPLTEHWLVCSIRQSTTTHILLYFFCTTQVSKAAVTD